MAIERKYHYKSKNMLRDVRTIGEKVRDGLLDPAMQVIIFGMSAGGMLFAPYVYYGADLIFILAIFYFLWLRGQGHKLPGKLPMSASLDKIKDKNNNGPGRNERAEGIMFVGNVKDTNEEIWFTSSDIKTHILYLGTTGAGKTVGLTSLVTNAMTWGSGYVYVDGKADTGLWSSLSALARRFGRDDDLLVLNYMTANSDDGGISNTLNPFAGGSASYLVNLLVSLMPDAGGDNAMWKERAVSLIGSIMPALTWKRENQEVPLNINSIREYLNLPKIIQLSRDPDLPRKISHGIKGYLDTLPGYSDEYFDDDGNEKPVPPDGPMVDTATIYQQHGYLSMQFTRSLQSLADDYGYVFETENADIDMTDVVLNRRIMVVLIPALEKSSDEAANLGKIVAANIKGMMGSTLGADVEGDAAATIENKPSESRTPFMTVFDEVGYYASQGMAVMAAQARSLGFCLVYAAQDLPAMEKRVKEEARSITANCNLKIFGKLEDPTQTKEFFEKTVGDVLVAEVSGFETQTGSLTNSYRGKQDASMQSRSRASYDGLRGFKEGQAVVTFGEMLEEIQFFYANPGNAKSMRVQRMLEPPKVDAKRLRQKHTIINFLDNYRTKGWSMASAIAAVDTEKEIQKLADGFKLGRQAEIDLLECGALGVAVLGETFLENYADEIAQAEQKQATSQPASSQPAAPASSDADDDDDFSWGDMMSDSDDSDDDGGFSWGDFSDEGEDNNNSASQASTQAVPAQAAASHAPSSDDDDDDFSFGDIMGNSNETASEKPAQNKVPAVEVEAKQAPQAVSNVQTTPTDGDDDDDFSFGDIMGSSDDDGNKEAEPVQAAQTAQSPDVSKPSEEKEPLSWGDLVNEEGEHDSAQVPVEIEPEELLEEMEEYNQGEGSTMSSRDDANEDDDSDFSFGDIMGGSDDDDAQEQIPEQESVAQNIEPEVPSHVEDKPVSQNPTQSVEDDYDTLKAVKQAKADGSIELPSGLSDDVHSLLETTAKTVTSGLFSSDAEGEDDFEGSDKEEREKR